MPSYRGKEPRPGTGQLWRGGMDINAPLRPPRGPSPSVNQMLTYLLASRAPGGKEGGYSYNISPEGMAQMWGIGQPPRIGRRRRSMIGGA